MGFQGLLLLGLLLSGGNPRVASQSLNVSTTQTPNERARPSKEPSALPQTTDQQSERTEPSHPGGSPASQRLWIHQLRRPVVDEHVPNTQGPEASGPLQPRLQNDMLETIMLGPDLNPPAEPDPKLLVDLEQRVPVPADSVAVRCGEGEVVIEVKQNFLGNNQLIRPSDLTLGGCGLLHVADRILRFRTELQGCGSTAKMTDEALIYTFSLIYSPAPVGSTFIFKTNPVEVLIECHYPRRRYVSSDAMVPHWQTFASSVVTERQLHFSLRLMTDDWQSHRPTSVYFLGDVMRIEASVLQGHHVPLRVYVDTCVATLDPDPNSQPGYTFINNHGCLRDAKLTGAKSYFMQRSHEDKLAFQLEAFKFHRDHRNSLYITCQLTATAISAPVSAQYKACSFLTEANRWVASGGDNEVCSCCQSSCSRQRRKRNLEEDAGLVQWNGRAALGPILVEEYFHTRVSQPQSNSPLQTQAASSPSLVVLCAVGAALAVVLLAVMAAAICSRVHKPPVKVST
ncbi:zona pellucida sperm-binding protein 3-like [Dunckerocampus dactyliophorus]|uniref:zona pellucida sperm-binding protein 3-like n=1 Tax=Dunckerocampus dactyliophorus TaxID=161453 RepID=UPI00240730BA|nr:zona pellucida sperm-binding protein 3-like [Dunckerocampus dactyliophorus]